MKTYMIIVTEEDRDETMVSFKNSDKEMDDFLIEYLKEDGDYDLDRNYEDSNDDYDLVQNILSEYPIGIVEFSGFDPVELTTYNPTWYYELPY